MRTCVLITVFALLAQVESGYEYPVPGVAWAQGGQQQNDYLTQASQSSAPNAQKAISYSQHTYQNNGQYQQSYQNTFHSNVYNQIQSGSVSQNVQQTNFVNTQTGQPVVTKHIYFHVPPPDEDAVRPVQPLPAKRKSYNIIFIKLPSNKVRYNPYANTEAKTVIYVLVKNPEERKALSESSKPNHEVFYVKYKGSVNNAAAQISTSVPHNSGLQLRPGLVNGQ